MSGPSMDFSGSCPFLTCDETGAHSHAVCTACDAVRHGNPFGCTECFAVMEAERAAHGLAPFPFSPPGGAST